MSFRSETQRKMSTQEGMVNIDIESKERWVITEHQDMKVINRKDKDTRDEGGRVRK